MSQASATLRGSEQTEDKNAIRPFHVNFPDAKLADLRKRVNATVWPEKETVTDS